MYVHSGCLDVYDVRFIRVTGFANGKPWITSILVFAMIQFMCLMAHSVWIPWCVLHASHPSHPELINGIYACMYNDPMHAFRNRFILNVTLRHDRSTRDMPHLYVTRAATLRVRVYVCVCVYVCTCVFARNSHFPEGLIFHRFIFAAEVDILCKTLQQSPFQTGSMTHSWLRDMTRRHIYILHPPTALPIKIMLIIPAQKLDGNNWN